MSRVVMPIVGPVGKMETEEGFMVADMDMNLLDIAEGCYKIRQDMCRDGWHYSKNPGSC